ncbi:MAG: hypothetical protein ACR2HJ_06370 [Fimbriimonadales bacterium]
MLNSKATLIAATALGVGALAIPFAQHANAQESPPLTNPPQQPAQIPQPPMMDRGMFMGQASMLMDSGALYIYQGGHIYKVRTSDLNVLAHTDLQAVMQGARRGGGAGGGGTK